MPVFVPSGLLLLIFAHSLGRELSSKCHCRFQLILLNDSNVTFLSTVKLKIT